jgi:hypothetical protein
MPTNPPTGRGVTPPGWVLDLIDTTADLPAAPAGEYRLVLSHTAPDGAVTTVDYGRLDASGPDGMALLGQDYDWGDNLPVVGPVVAVQREPIVHLRLLLSARVVPDEDTGAYCTTTTAPGQ